MTNLRWLLAIPVVLAATLVAAPATVEGGPYAIARGCSAKMRSRRPTPCLKKLSVRAVSLS